MILALFSQRSNTRNARQRSSEITLSESVAVTGEMMGNSEVVPRLVLPVQTVKFDVICPSSFAYQLSAMVGILQGC